jgi:hypothetical protein
MAVIGFLLLCFEEWNALLDKEGDLLYPLRSSIT